MRRALFLCVLLVPLAALGHRAGVGIATPPAHAAEPALHVTAGAPSPFPVAAHRVLDLDADGRAEILVVGRAGEVRVLRRGEDGKLGPPAGALVLPHPERTLLAVVDLDGSGGPLHLLAVSPAGVHAYPASPGGGIAARGVRLSDRARFGLRVGSPRFAPISRDLDGDGRPDVVVPSGDQCGIWMQQPPRETGAGASGTPPSLVRTATVRVDVTRTVETEAEALTDLLRSSFRIPDLAVEDVNGDGRPDLRVIDGDIRAFHLQREDGTLPEDPDVRIDLEMFRDTTPKGDVRLGGTLAGGDRRRYESRDLDGDGIPDHVIAHRRKVWVFHGGPEGPQFTKPTAILKSAQDVSALLLVRVDEDPHPDLILVRVQIPSAAGLLKGLLTEWDVSIDAVGYAAQKGRGFATTPAWRGGLTVRLPAILGVLRDPDALIRRFEEVGRRFRASATGDLDGDGRQDVALATEGDAPRLEVWRGVKAGGDGEDGDAERALGRLFFEDEDRTWTLDRVIGALGSLAERRAQRLTGGRPADGSAGLRGPGFNRVGMTAADLDGDGRDEVVIAYRRDGTGVTRFDVADWR